MTNIDPADDFFTTTLILDVTTAHEQFREKDTPALRRSLVRTTFAGIEGLLWFVKVRVIAGKVTKDIVSAQELDALNERGHVVTNNGELREVQKFLPIVTSIKLVVRLLQRLEPTSFKADFSSQGWRDLCEAIKIRNRVVHPKCQEDLSITDADIHICLSGFNWMTKLVIIGQYSVIEHFESLNAQFERKRNESVN
ncbi:MAG: hypothetical protein ACT6T0_16255, partial [Nevskia sp.]|uniref:hypothetical protein n=1 Tax=Nevskia sp. TaxID=1929292 RepID=UPI004035FC93